MTTASSASDSDPAGPRFFYGWVILAACFVVTTVASGTMMGFGVFITPMAEDMAGPIALFPFRMPSPPW